MAQTREVRCPVDNVLFGIELDDGKSLSIKNRDLYRVFHGGKVEGPCRGCGKQLVWESK